MPNNDRSKLLGSIKQNEEVKKFNELSSFMLEGFRLNNENYLDLTDTNYDYLYERKFDVDNPNILENVKDTYHLSYLIEMEAINRVSDDIKNGHLTLKDTRVFGGDEISIGNYLKSAVIEETVRIAGKLLLESNKNPANKGVDTPISLALDRAYHNNYALATRMAHKDTMDLVNPSSDMDKGEIDRNILAAETLAWDSLMKAYRVGLSEGTIKSMGLEENAFNYARLRDLREIVESPNPARAQLVGATINVAKAMFDGALEGVRQDLEMEAAEKLRNKAAQNKVTSRISPRKPGF